MQRAGLRVGRACYQSHTHQLEPFNWDADGVRGIYDAHHPIFNLYLGDHQKLVNMVIGSKSCSSQNKRGDGSLWDIRLVAFMMFINLPSLLVTLVTTENRTQKHKISNRKNEDGMTVYRSCWEVLSAKIGSKNIRALKKQGWDDSLWELLGGAVCGL